MLNSPSWIYIYMLNIHVEYPIFSCFFFSPSFGYLWPIGHFDIANPGNMPGRVLPRTQFIWAMFATSLPVAQWCERPTSIWEVMVWVPSGTQIFSLSHARDMLNTPSFLGVNVLEKDLLRKLHSVKTWTSEKALLVAITKVKVLTDTSFNL